MNVRDLLLALLRCAIKGEALDIGALRESLSRENVATLFKVAKKHDVAHLVCYALEKCEIDLDGEVGALFKKEKEQAVLRYEMIQADINDICSCFDSEGIAYVPLKGAVIRSYYPQPWMRTSCDIDILVSETALDWAVKTLTEKFGYRVEGKKNYHDISLYSPFGMHLELHHNIKENEPKYDKLLTRVWEFVYDDYGAKHIQENEFLMFHLTAHMAYHFVGGGCGLRSVLDLWLLNKALDLNKEKLNKFLCECGLATFYEQIISLGRYWFENESEAEDTIKQLEIYILLGGAYGTQKQGAVSRQVKKGGKFKYIISRVFMPYESLSVLYPIIKKHKILTPFCQIARWFSAITKGKRIKKEIRDVAGATKEQTENTKALFEKLGL